MYYNCMSFASSLCVNLLMHIMPCHVRVRVIILRNLASKYMTYKTLNNEGHTPCRMYQHLFHCPKHSLHVKLFEEL